MDAQRSGVHCPAATVPAALLQELKEQKEELLTKVQALKTDLQDWRSKLEAQVKNYKTVCWSFAVCSTGCRVDVS